MSFSFFDVFSGSVFSVDAVRLHEVAEQRLLRHERRTFNFLHFAVSQNDHLVCLGQVLEPFVTRITVLFLSSPVMTFSKMAEPT